MDSQCPSCRYEMLDRQQNYLQIQRYTSRPDIFEVQGYRLAPREQFTAADLSEPGDAGLARKPDQFLRRVVLQHLRRFWTRSDDPHISHHYGPQVRELV